MDRADERRGRWAEWGRRIAVAPHVSMVAGALLTTLAVAESIVQARGGPLVHSIEGVASTPVRETIAHTLSAPTPPDNTAIALYLFVLPLVGLATTLPIALLWAQRTAAAVLVSASIVLSLAAFQTLTVAGLAAQLVAGYRLGRGGSRLTALLLAAPFPVLALTDMVAGPSTSYTPGGEARVLTLMLASLAPAAALAGIARRAHGEALRNTAAQQVIADSLLEHTARGERARIARELHDVVAHHISMVAVQAETARLTTPGMPAAGADRLSAIGDTARAALTEMRRLLGVLREDAKPDAAVRQPQPGLSLRELNELLDESRDASGTGVRLILRGPPVTLDPGVELAAYRIVQEALTNARRHAPGAAVDVELDYTGDALRLLVRDNGPGPSTEVPAGGHGLSGMRERAAAVGGELRAGPAAAGGFLVEACLPGKDEAAR
ncbi:sensor histidine kinase [Sphaerisporangium perillae]|uniref:sensor histidine kinase n=1 Tax=Sphaerisporangium perillae TaxID=2935860 RepID=UPI00200EA3A5|nr:sensor histidine kinase [Sphaerisporangium perillae]